MQKIFLEERLLLILTIVKICVFVYVLIVVSLFLLPFFSKKMAVESRKYSGFFVREQNSQEIETVFVYAHEQYFT